MDRINPTPVPYNPKLEGIQKGIEVFGDMTLKQLDFIAKRLALTPVVRGCQNVCSHCCVNAKPPIREDGIYINKIAWQDFKDFNEGFQELNSRLGYNIFANERTYHGYNDLFFDSDSSYVALTDENGVEHDLIELAGMINKTTGQWTIFDTAGWNPKDKGAQARMEKYAEYYGNSANPFNLLKVNFSVNPFQSIYTASVKALQRGDLEKAEQHRNSYIERTANAFFTLTPIIKRKILQFIPRALHPNTQAKGFTIDDCYLLFIDVFRKLEEKYIEDLNSERKHITSKEQISEIMGELLVRLKSFEPLEMPYGRLADLMPKDYYTFETQRQEIQNILPRLFNVKLPDCMLVGLVDLNGKFYLRDELSIATVATELAFNFKNKDKLTQTLKPNLLDFTFTNDILDTILAEPNAVVR